MMRFFLFNCQSAVNRQQIKKVADANLQQVQYVGSSTRTIVKPCYIYMFKENNSYIG